MAEYGDGDGLTVFHLRVTATARVSTLYRVRATTLDIAKMAAKEVAGDSTSDAWEVVEFESDDVDIVCVDEQTGGEVLWEPSKRS